MISLNYHHLYYFYSIARAGSIAKAGAALHLAQPTLSAQLKQFEKAIGRRLFDRKNRRLRLTGDGRLVLNYAESIFETGRELEDALRDRPEAGSAPVQVGILNATPKAFGHALLECLLGDPGAAGVTAHEESLDELASGLRQHRLDAALTDTAIGGPEDKDLASNFICRIPVVLAAAPEVARRCRKFPEYLAREALIMPSQPSQVLKQVQDTLAAMGMSPVVAAQVQDVETARRLALSGRGIAPLNNYTVAASLPAGGLRVLPPGNSLGVHETIYLVTRRRRRPSPLMDRLVTNFREKLKKFAVKPAH